MSAAEMHEENITIGGRTWNCFMPRGATLSGHEERICMVPEGRHHIMVNGVVLEPGNPDSGYRVRMWYQAGRGIISESYWDTWKEVLAEQYRLMESADIMIMEHHL